jgi:glycosyltransferase involved in cell wall biosynthesis
LRILYDHQVFSLQNAGGASRYHYEILRYLSGVAGIEAELFLGLNQTIYPFDKLRSSTIKVQGRRSSLARGMFRYAINEVLEAAISPFRGIFDIYHPTYFRPTAMIRSRRLVVTHHDSTYEQFPHLFRDAYLVFRSRRAMYSKVDRVICISEADRQGFLQFYNVDPAKTCVIHHGLNVLPRSVEAAEDLRSRTRRPFVLYVGARNCHKNFGTFLQAFRGSRLHEDYDLLALGGGPLTQLERETVSALELADALICVPSVSDEFLSEAYAAAALFAYPSLSEGFGMPPLEAMAAGCPVATSNVSAMPEVCQDAPFYFDPCDVGSMAQALVRGVTDQEARDLAIARGKRVASGYSWEKCGALTLAAYRMAQ